MNAPVDRVAARIPGEGEGLEGHTLRPAGDPAECPDRHRGRRSVSERRRRPCLRAAGTSHAGDHAGDWGKRAPSASSEGRRSGDPGPCSCLLPGWCASSGTDPLRAPSRSAGPTARCRSKNQSNDPWRRRRPRRTIEPDRHRPVDRHGESEGVTWAGLSTGTVGPIDTIRALCYKRLQ
jgi:hypothetical protein